MLKNILPTFKVNAWVENDQSLPPQYQLVLEQQYYRLAEADRANEHLDGKSMALLQAAGLILALTGVLKFPAAMYSDGLGVKIGIAIGFLAFAGMVLLALSATRPSDSPMPGADSWDKIYDKYVTVEIENAFDQVLVDSLEAYRLLCDLNQHKATRLQWSIALFGIQLAGLLLLALAS